jgi:hypothetical protein
MSSPVASAKFIALVPPLPRVSHGPDQLLAASPAFIELVRVPRRRDVPSSFAS